MRVEELAPARGPHYELITPAFLRKESERAAPSLQPAGFHPVRIEDLAPAPPLAVRPLRDDELTSELHGLADDVLWKFDAPLGTEVLIDADGKKYVARFEQHYHEEGGPQRPWGWHKGVTLYATD